MYKVPLYLFQKLNVFLRFNLVVVDKCSVGAAQVHHVQLDSPALGGVGSGVGDQSVLEHRVLLATRQVVQGHISNLNTMISRFETSPSLSI